MNTRKWLVQKTDSEKCAVLQRELGILPVTAKLLCIRGFDTPEKARAFLLKDSKLHDPFLLKDMDKAVLRIKQALSKHERICIYGDYDVDGVTATTLLYTYLKRKGADCCYYIPERISEGYGLSIPVIERLAGGIDLMITVDTGITAIIEAAYAKQIGIDMIITDHHSCREELPDVVAVVNPHREDSEYPFKQLAGVGVVFKLLCALEGNADIICREYAEITAIGTIADVMPIVDENRYIASIGLKKLENTSYPGLYALMRHSGIIKDGKTKKILSSTVGYVIAPRINAAGRITSASKAVELLLADDDETADCIAAELCEINKIRQAAEQEIYGQALEMIACGQSGKKFLVLCSKGWHQGVIGVVASKLSEKYCLPCILFSITDGVGKGSGRSIKGFSLMDALSSCSDLLIEYGGHELAAGLSIEAQNIDEFRRRINEYAEEHLPEQDSVLTVDVDCEVSFNEINLKSIEEIQRLEPFGLQNPVPIFVMRSVVISELTALSGGKHVRMKLHPLEPIPGCHELNAVYFGSLQSGICLYTGDVCDIAFSVDINEYMGICTPQLLIRAVKITEKNNGINNNDCLYEKVCDDSNHEKLPDYIMPSLSDFRTVFRFLKRQIDTKSRRMSVISVCKQLTVNENLDMNTCKARIIFDVLSQESIVKLNYIGSGGDIFEMEFLPVVKKVNLDDSILLKKIKKKNFYID